MPNVGNLSVGLPKIDVSGLKNSTGAIFQKGAIVDMLRKHVRKAVILSVELIARKAKENAPKNEGMLVKNINAQVNASGFEGSVGTPLIQGLIMEQGRGAGKPPPPLDAMMLWVKRRGLSMTVPQQVNALAWAMAKGIAKKRGGKMPPVMAIEASIIEKNKRMTREQQIKSIAYAMRISIGRKGIKPRLWLSKALTDSESRIKMFMAQAVADFRDEMERRS